MIGVRHISEELADNYCAGAREALPHAHYRRLRQTVLGLIRRGELTRAKAVADDEVTLASLQGEIKRHRGEHRVCCEYGGYLGCLELEHLEDREEFLIAQITNITGQL